MANYKWIWRIEENGTWGQVFHRNVVTFIGWEIAAGWLHCIPVVYGSQKESLSLRSPYAVLPESPRFHRWGVSAGATAAASGHKTLTVQRQNVHLSFQSVAITLSALGGTRLNLSLNCKHWGQRFISWHQQPSFLFVSSVLVKLTSEDFSCQSSWCVERRGVSAPCGNMFVLETCWSWYVIINNNEWGK